VLLRRFSEHIRSQNWLAAIIDFLVVVLGIFVALQVDNWNQNRIERIEEAGYVDRLLTEVRSDLQSFEFRLAAFEEKSASLSRVEATFEIGATDDPRRFLEDVIVGANFGWNQGLSERSTFDELVSSGNLDVIQDETLRLRIARYYRRYEDEHFRIEARETVYPNLSYRLVPRAEPDLDAGIVNESQIMSGLSEAETSELVSGVLNSEISDYVTAERNLALFMSAITLGLQSQARSLAEGLEQYQAAMR
jgi:hypothetical protein